MCQTQMSIEQASAHTSYVSDTRLLRAVAPLQHLCSVLNFSRMRRHTTARCSAVLRLRLRELETLKLRNDVPGQRDAAKQLEHRGLAGGLATDDGNARHVQVQVVLAVACTEMSNI